MNPDFVFALHVFCMDYHSGQWSRLYRLGCRIDTRYRPCLSDRAYAAIRHGGKRTDPHDEWMEARVFYRQLKRKYANDKK